MIGKLVRIQLVLFVALTLIGVSYVGARYAGLDDLILGRGYHVTADFADSGGIFETAEVTYRGVGVGRVDKLMPTPSGVEVRLALEDDAPRIPADTVAVVANRSAIGEQYIDLQPRRDGAPYLDDGATIARRDTKTPIATTKLLLDLDRLVNSVGKEDLTTVIDELGDAFWGTGEDLSRIVDSGNALIESADDNLEQTIALIEDGSTVLKTQRESGGVATAKKVPWIRSAGRPTSIATPAEARAPSRKPAATLPVACVTWKLSTAPAAAIVNCPSES